MRKATARAVAEQSSRPPHARGEANRGKQYDKEARLGRAKPSRAMHLELSHAR